ncbi:MAG: hypothetical protein ACYDCK_09060 [Thermoplasmatota archaeon]
MEPKLSLSLLIVFAILAGCASSLPDPYARAPDGSKSDAGTIPEFGFLEPPVGSPSTPIHVRATIEVTRGGPIDAWLTNATNCRAFLTRAFRANASLLNATSGKMDADFPPGPDCLVLDNTDFAFGKAEPTGNVTVSYRLDVWERR